MATGTTFRRPFHPFAVRNPADSEDVLQEVALVIVETLGSTIGKKLSSVGHWECPRMSSAHLRKKLKGSRKAGSDEADKVADTEKASSRFEDGKRLLPNASKGFQEIAANVGHAIREGFESGRNRRKVCKRPNHGRITTCSGFLEGMREQKLAGRALEA